MTENSPAAKDAAGDLPTPAADLKISTVPAQLKITAGRARALTAIVPHTEARHLITTSGITGCVAMSTGGVVWVLRSSPALALHAAEYVALAVLALGLVAVALIAVCGHQRRTRTPSSEQDTGGTRPQTKREALPP